MILAHVEVVKNTKSAMEPNEEKNYCILHILRHGETEGNAQGILQGYVADSPLTEKGIEQARNRAEELKDINFDAIFSSDLSRTYKTAEIVKLDREIVIQTSKLLRERNYGKFDGLNASIFRQALKDKLKEKQDFLDEHYWSFKVADDVESYEEIVQRFILQLREISVAYPDKHILIVSHGACIRNFLIKIGYATIKELPSGSLENTAYVKVLSDGVDFFVKDVNGINKKNL